MAWGALSSRSFNNRRHGGTKKPALPPKPKPVEIFAPAVKSVPGVVPVPVPVPVPMPGTGGIPDSTSSQLPPSLCFPCVERAVEKSLNDALKAMNKGIQPYLPAIELGIGLDIILGGLLLLLLI
jgi:hypothetical protein